MSEKVKRKSFIDVVNKVRPALSTQDFLPILSCVCFDGDNIYAYNDWLAISFPNTLDIPFEGAIPGDRLAKVLNSFNTEEVSCKVTKDSVKISSGKSNIKLPFMPEDDLVWEGVPKKGHTEVAIGEELIEGLNRCLISISNDAMHPEHQGVQLSCDDEVLLMHSTDNTTLSQFMLEDDFDDFDPVVLPEMFCKQLISIFYEMKAPVMHINKDGVWVKDKNGVIIASKLLHTGAGTNFSEIIEKYTDGFKGTFFDIAKTDLIQSIDRALIINGDNADKITSAELNKGTLTLETKTEKGHAVDEIVMPKVRKAVAKDKVSIHFSTDLVSRACRSMTSIAFKEDVILFKAGTDFIHLVALRSSDA